MKIKKYCTKYQKKLFKEIRAHKLIYILLLIILISAMFVRTYRVGQILGFYFDQGRDAMKIWNFWHHGDIFLIGPTTGIAGIFRGPYYYYLIAPFYLLGKGNPVYPTIFLSFTNVLAILLLYYLTYLVSKSRVTGLFAATFASFSFNLVLAGRWLSNPTPMLLFSMLLLWSMFAVSDGRRWAWTSISLISGLSLFSFGSSGEFFYFLALAIFFIWQKKNWPTRKIFITSIALFFLTAFPQILFDIKNRGLLRNNIKKFIFEEESFKNNFWEVAKARIFFYYDVFSNKIFHWRRRREIILFFIPLIVLLIKLPKLIKNKYLKITLLLFLSPLVGLLFFQGNYGNIYDYYLTGYYLVFILLFTVGLGEIWKWKLGKLFIIYFFVVFFVWDGRVVHYRITAGVDGEDTIAFGNQKQAIEWIYKDASGNFFNVDVYVPPVIPHAYDYLFTWLGSTKYYPPSEEQIELLYTLYEVDNPHPERLDAWLERQVSIGEVQYEEQFGGITVQRRKRISDGQN